MMNSLNSIYFEQMLSGNMTDNDIASYLVQLADRGETADDIAAAATAMRARMIKAKVPYGAIDVCGTGGGAEVPCVLRRDETAFSGRNAYGLGTRAARHLASDHR